jgi:Tfp pilus assembly protein PilF
MKNINFKIKINLMATTLDNQALTPEEKQFNQCLATGDDFIKIEIFRSAAAYYKRAIEIRPDDPEASQKLAETNEKIKKENRAIYTIVAVFVVAVILAVVLV